MNITPEMIESLLKADTAYFEEIKAKYGEPRAASLSELANLAALARVIPQLQDTVSNLIPHTIDAFGIEMTEGLLVIKKCQQFRMLHLNPRTQH